MSSTEAAHAPSDFDPVSKTCIFCGSQEVHGYDRDYTGIRIGRCRACGLKFMNPVYSDRYLEEYYGGESYLSRVDLDDVESLDDYTIHLGHMKLLRGFASDGRFLSIGSGSGVELVLARRMGWEVEGFDIDEAVAAHIRESLGVPFHSGDFFALDVEPASYAVVYMDQVLEHLKQPRRTLERVYELLQPGGVLYLGLPNLGGAASRWKTLTGRLGLKQRRGKHYDTFHHVAYYAPGVVRTLLTEILDFEEVAILGDPDPGAGPIKASLERRLRFGSTFVALFRKR